MTVIADSLASMANWTAVHGVGLSSTGSAAQAQAISNYDGSQHNTALASGDHRASAILGGLHSLNYLDVKIRHNGSSGASRNGWQVSVGGSNEYYISEVTGGSGTDRVSGTVSLSDGQVLMGEAEGTAIRLKLNGTTINSYTSSLYQSNTRVALGIYRGGATNATFANFAAEDLAAPPPADAYLTLPPLAPPRR